MKLNSKYKRVIVIISGIILFISALSLVLSIYFANRLQGRLAERQLQMYLDRIDLEDQIEFNNLYFTLNIAKGWINNGLLADNNQQDLNGKFISLIANTPQVTAISFVQSTGETYNLRYEKTAWESYLTENDSLNKKHVLLNNKTKQINYKGDTVVKFSVTSLPNYHKHLNVDYDSRVRYPLQFIPGMSRLPGICYSLKTQDTINNREYILTAYMTLERIYKFLSSLKNTQNSQVFLFTADGRFFNFDRIDIENQKSSDIDNYLVPWEEAGTNLFYTALTKWKKEKKSDSLEFLSIKHEGEIYWAAFRPYKDGGNGIWIGLILPEAEFSLVVKGRLGIVLIFSLILLVLSTFFVVVIVRRLFNGEELDSLTELELQDLIKAGENDFVEFKSTIRMNLHANKAGKEIELAWLKSVVAFCNTEGGRILIGVKDNGDIFGLEADNFSNDDKTLLHVQNLIKQHVGLEFAKYIQYTLQDIDGKKIVVVSCQSLSRPVFLRFNDKEQFFVRSGPASIELPVSKALEYIRDRDKG